MFGTNRSRRNYYSAPSRLPILTPHFSTPATILPAGIAGLLEVLRRQGLLNGIWCLDPNEGLSPGQSQEIDRVYSAYPHLNDDDFVRSNLDRWLSG